MLHPLDDIYGLIDRAKEHSANLEQVVTEYWSSENQATKCIDLERDPPHGFFCIQFKDPIPRSIRFIVRDAFSALRSALDQTGAACVRAAGRSDNSGTHFPFAKTKADFFAEPTRKGRTRIPSEVYEIMRSFKAYGDEDGDRGLYALNAVRNVNDHRFLIPVGQIAGSAKFGVGLNSHKMMALAASGVTHAMLNLTPIFPPQYDPTTNRLYLMVFDARIHDVNEFEATVQIAFGEAAGHLYFMDPIHTIRGLTAQVGQIVRTVESKAVEIGLFPPRAG